MSNHQPVNTPVVDGVTVVAAPEWVAFNWRNHAGLVRRPEAGATFAVATGEWAGEWIVRAREGSNGDLFFAERVEA